MKKDFNKDFEFFTDLIKSDYNFSYARYADGEVALMTGNTVGEESQAYIIDKWKAPGVITKVGLELLETFTHNEDNYYYAISSKTDQLKDYYFLKDKIKNQNNITYANLWINGNYQKMKSFYINLKKEVYLICNQVANKTKFPFKVVEIFPFPIDCVNYWETYGDDYIRQLSEYISCIKNKTLFIACGPISEIIIHKMYLINPDNQYVDVGSSMDEYIYGYQTRPYMNPSSQYAKEISRFHD